jgi:beta-1,4-N-acetylglucosaminyltransferase
LIFVTVGTHSEPFDRLIKKADEIAGTLDEEVVMQTGCSQYRPASARYFDYVDNREFIRLCSESRLIITHAGVGTILAGIKLNKPLLLVPRLKRYGEVFDDHQLEISEVLDGTRSIKVAYDVEKLGEMMNSTFPKVNAERKCNSLAVALKDRLFTLSR